MGYDGKINGKLRTVELNDDDECLYKLAYEEEKRSCFSREDILKYVNYYYLENDNISDNINDNMFEENLLNDLNTFKTYRDDVDTRVRKESDLGQFVTICLAMFSIIINVLLNPGSKKALVVGSGLIVMVSYLFYLYSASNKSESAKLKFITNAIYALETIKEDMDKNGYSGMKNTEMNCSVNDYQSDYKTYEKITKAKSFTENDEDSYDGLELTEVKEIRTYKARKNKYSPQGLCMIEKDVKKN